MPSGLAPSDLRASIAGIAATVDTIAYDGADATVGITTGAHGRTSATNSGRGAVELTVVATVGTSAASANATYEYIDLWSRSTTWGGGPPPVEGDTVWIQPNPNPNPNSNPNPNPNHNLRLLNCAMGVALRDIDPATRSFFKLFNKMVNR